MTLFKKEITLPMNVSHANTKNAEYAQPHTKINAMSATAGGPEKPPIANATLFNTMKLFLKEMQIPMSARNANLYAYNALNLISAPHALEHLTQAIQDYPLYNASADKDSMAILKSEKIAMVKLFFKYFKLN
jgi:hypothetical protein